MPFYRKRRRYRGKSAYGALRAANKDFRPGSNEHRAMFGASYPAVRAAYTIGDPTGIQQYINRKNFRYYGPGDYRDYLKYIPRALGAAAGAGYGYMKGGLTGAAEFGQTGWNKGGDFSKFVGWGDYGTVTGNQIVEGSGGPPPPIASVNSSDLSGDLYFAHSEFLGNVVVSGTAGQPSVFSYLTYAINPGLASSFPFFSQIANNFELYEPMGVIYQYRATSGEFSSSGVAIGKVIMTTQYDPDSVPFRNSVQMENYDYTSVTKPSVGAVHGVECKSESRSSNMLYVRAGTSSKDKVFTDLGLFQIATEGVPLPAGVTSMIVGELWVTYKFRLSRAQLFNAIGNSTLMDSISYATSGAVTTYKSTNSIGCTISGSPSGGQVLTFPTSQAGNAYYVAVWTNGTVTTTITPSAATGMTVFLPQVSTPTGTTLTNAVTYVTSNVLANTSQVQVGVLLGTGLTTSPNITFTWSSNPTGTVYYNVIQIPYQDTISTS